MKQQETLKQLGNMQHILIIADDFINSLPQNSLFWSFFTKARHFLCNIFTMSQVWRKIPNVARTQLTHICYFRNNHLELLKFIEEVMINFTGNKKKAIEIYETSPEKSTEYWIKTFAAKNIGQIGKRGKYPRAYAEYEHSLKPKLTKKGKDVGLIQDILIKRGDNAGKIDASLVEEGSYYYDLDKQTLQLYTDGALVQVNPNTLEIISQ